MDGCTRIFVSVSCEFVATEDKELLVFIILVFIEITKAAHRILEQLFRPGIRYKRSGVILSGIRPATPLQLQLFDPVPNRQDRAELMGVIDRINGKYGPKCIRLAVEGFKESPWHVKCENKSGNYLSDINEILEVRI